MFRMPCSVPLFVPRTPRGDKSTSLHRMRSVIHPLLAGIGAVLAVSVDLIWDGQTTLETPARSACSTTSSVALTAQLRAILPITGRTPRQDHSAINTGSINPGSSTELDARRTNLKLLTEVAAVHRPGSRPLTTGHHLIAAVATTHSRRFRTGLHSVIAGQRKSRSMAAFAHCFTTCNPSGITYKRTTIQARVPGRSIN